MARVRIDGKRHRVDGKRTHNPYCCCIPCEELAEHEDDILLSPTIDVDHNLGVFPCANDPGMDQCGRIDCDEINTPRTLTREPSLDVPFPLPGARAWVSDYFGFSPYSDEECGGGGWPYLALRWLVSSRVDCPEIAWSATLRTYGSTSLSGPWAEVYDATVWDLLTTTAGSVYTLTDIVSGSSVYGGCCLINSGTVALLL